MNDENFRLALIEITDNNLLNDFVNNIFDYDFNSNECVYIQYKLVYKNIVLNIFDNKNSNRFKAYIFTKDNFESDDISNYINVNDFYNKYKQGSKDKMVIFASLLITNSDNEKREIIDSLFDGKIREIFLNHFL